MEVVAYKPLPQRPLGRRARRTINRALRNQGVVETVAVKPIVTQAVNGPKKRKRNRRRQRVGEDNTQMVEYSPNIPLNNRIVPQPPGVSTGKNNMAPYIRRNMGKLSAEGMKFLKCAFSAADFDGAGNYGVPDKYGGKSLAVKHRGVFSFNFDSANTDYYFLVLPTPGFAYYLATTVAGVPPTAATVWRGVPYSDYSGLFGPTGLNAAINITKFRYVSQHFELVPTTNSNQWTGNVQSWKVPVAVEEALYGSGADTLTILGLNGTVATNQDMYTGPMNLGVYVGAFNKGGSDWGFSRIHKSRTNIPASLSAVAGVDFGEISGGSLAIPGFDNNFETICIKVSGMGPNVANTAILKSWACVEYQFVPGNPMYEMQVLHQESDEIALEMYRKIVVQLPVGVSYLDNENFWNRVLNIIRNISGGLSLLPGPYGLVAGGVHSIATGMSSLIL